MLVPLLLTACDPEVAPDTGSPTTTGHTGDPAPLDCGPHCVDQVTEAGAATCYACRCKEAMGGWLPSPAELQCSRAEPLDVLVVDGSGALTATRDQVATCANPSLLYGTCAPGSRLGQLEQGDVTVKWICRRNTYHPDSDRLDLPYDDVGAILHNQRNGQTCWFDDIDGTGIAGDNWPDLDLTAPDADADAFVELFYRTLGDGCTGCHDNDPFVFTPFFPQDRWDTGDYVFGGFALTGLDGGSIPVPQQRLVSPEVGPCLTCHRLTSGATCSEWAPQSMGAHKGAGHQPEVVEAAADPDRGAWPLGIWMPPDPADQAVWERTYGAARDRIAECCAAPGVETERCRWEDL
jgi:hypothetical protein